MRRLWVVVCVCDLYLFTFPRGIEKTLATFCCLRWLGCCRCWSCCFYLFKCIYSFSLFSSSCRVCLGYIANISLRGADERERGRDHDSHVDFSMTCWWSTIVRCYIQIVNEWGDGDAFNGPIIIIILQSNVDNIQLHASNERGSE